MALSEHNTLAFLLLLPAVASGQLTGTATSRKSDTDDGKDDKDDNELSSTAVTALGIVLFGVVLTLVMVGLCPPVDACAGGWLGRDGKRRTPLEDWMRTSCRRLVSRLCIRAERNRWERGGGLAFLSFFLLEFWGELRVPLLLLNNEVNGQAARNPEEAKPGLGRERATTRLSPNIELNWSIAEEDATGSDHEVMVWEVLGGQPASREASKETTGWDIRGSHRKEEQRSRGSRGEAGSTGVLPPGCK